MTIKIKCPGCQSPTTVKVGASSGIAAVVNHKVGGAKCGDVVVLDS